MDHYIVPEALVCSEALRKIKLENYEQACKEYTDCAVELKSLPSKIILQTTDRCNLSCPMCQIVTKEKRSSMSLEIFDKVVDQLFPTLIELHPTNVGEALVSPWFDYLCEKMHEYGVLLDLTTNGMLLSEEKINKMVPIARDIKISFDGANEKTFTKIRRGANFEKICANVRNLSKALKERSPVQGVIVALQMTLMRSNFEELPDLIKLAKELGANRVKAYHLFSFFPSMDGESLMSNLELWDPVLEKSLAVGKEYGIELQLAEASKSCGNDALLEKTICHLPWHESWIDFDGHVYSCHSHGGISAGNILKSSFSSMWNSTLYRDIRFNFLQGKPQGPCHNCGMNFKKQGEHQVVPYDQASFLKPKSLQNDESVYPIRWSGRMRPFDLSGRNANDRR